MKNKKKPNRFVLFHPATGKYFECINFSGGAKRVPHPNNAAQSTWFYLANFTDNINDAEILSKVKANRLLNLYFEDYVTADYDNNFITYRKSDLKLLKIKIEYSVI